MFSQLHLRILESRWTVIDRRWDGYDIYSSFWRVYVNKCDGASVEIPGRGAVALKGDTMYFIPAWVRFITHTCQPVDHLYIHFDLIGMNNAALREIFTSPIQIRGNVSFDTLTERLAIRPETGNTSLEFACRVESIIFDALADIMAGLPASSKRLLDRAMASQNRFSEILHYIDNHLGSDLSNPLLAKRAHMSLSHFVRTFKTAVGQSPANYVLQQRIALAAQELIFTSVGIDDIADKFGFANRFHFSRHFKQIMGISPGAYRKITPI